MLVAVRDSVVRFYRLDGLDRQRDCAQDAPFWELRDRQDGALMARALVSNLTGKV